MRFDSTSKNSFLNEIFDHVKATQKTISIYLGENKTITIGDMTAKFTQSGYSSIEWMTLPDDQGFGKMLQVSNIAVEDNTEDKEDEEDQTIPALITLSASYIGLPENIINSIFVKSFSKLATCKVDTKTNYGECTFSSSKSMQKIMSKNVILSF